MRCYNRQHKFYCGIDLHARKMYVCIIDQAGKIRVHQNLKTDPELQNTSTQYNLPALNKSIPRKFNHDGVAECFDDPSVHAAVEADLSMIEAFNRWIRPLEWQIEKAACHHDANRLCIIFS